MENFSWLRHPIQGVMTKENLDSLVSELARHKPNGESSPSPTLEDAAETQSVPEFFTGKRAA